MALSICSIASGSRGNCVLVKGGNTTLLIDLGIPSEYLVQKLESLNISPAALDGVLITHEHGDHTNGLPAFCRRFPVPVYMREDAAAGIKKRWKKDARNHACVLFGGEDFFIKGLGVSPIELPHDVPCTGFSIWDREEKLSVITDLGVLTPRVLQSVGDSGILMIESNHDPDLLRASAKYPAVLKRRILSARGHLSNADCAEAVVRLYAAGRLKRVILAHLSLENNYPDLALSTLRAAFARAGLSADGLAVSVAEQYKVSGFITAGAEGLGIDNEEARSVAN
ncbi:MAG: MBL fold metallo-hydrolase [Clostridiales bacterium]|jgi:phosphoribosyl 1,2-cyclic phosphodiesterase|nr:MBL fold metallo-hydrolase [Clostridiales bacterium]